MPTIEVQNSCGSNQAAGVCKAVEKVTGAVVRKAGPGKWEVAGGEEKKAVKYLECALQKGCVVLDKGDDEDDLDIVWVPAAKVGDVMELNSTSDVFVFETRWKLLQHPLKTVQIGVFGPTMHRMDTILAICQTLGDMTWLRKVNFYNFPAFKPLQNNFTQAPLESIPSFLKKNSTQQALREASGCDSVRLIANTLYVYSGDTKPRRAAVHYASCIAKAVPAEGSVTFQCPVQIPLEKVLVGRKEVLVYFAGDSEICLVSRTNQIELCRAKIAVMRHIENSLKKPHFTSKIQNEKSPDETGTDTFVLHPTEVPKFSAFKRKTDHFHTSGQLTAIGQVVFITGDQGYRKTVRHALADFLEKLYNEKNAEQVEVRRGVEEEEEPVPSPPKKKRKTSSKKKKQHG